MPGEWSADWAIVTTTSPVVRRRRLGQELRLLREAAFLTGEDAALKLGWSNSKLSRIETGRNAAKDRDVVALLDLYRVKGSERREPLLALARDARRKGWWQLYKIPYSTYVGLEADAVTMRTYEVVVPGLFQTAAYAEAIDAATVPGLDHDALDQWVEVRIARQALLTKEHPLEVRAVVDESALRRMVGGAHVMKEQLGHLLELASLTNVLLQVIPFSAGAHPGTLTGPFIVLSFGDHADPDVVYLESHADPYLDRQADVSRYINTFDHLRSAAISVAQTKAMIRNLVKEL